MSLGAITRDQAKKIAQAIFDDIELSRCLSLDRVTDVIERTARMEQTTFHLSGPEFDNFATALDSLPVPTETLVALFNNRAAAWAANQTIIQPDD